MKYYIYFDSVSALFLYQKINFKRGNNERKNQSIHYPDSQ